MFVGDASAAVFIAHMLLMHTKRAAAISWKLASSFCKLRLIAHGVARAGTNVIADISPFALVLITYYKSRDARLRKKRMFYLAPIMRRVTSFCINYRAHTV